MTPERQRTQRINKLMVRRVHLIKAKDYRGAIPIQLEIIELFEEFGIVGERRANAHNSASVLYLRCAFYAVAEWHARRALSLWDSETRYIRHSLNVRGRYRIALARILAAQCRYEEALPYGEKAVLDYGVFHNPPDEFLEQVIDEVKQIRNHTWSPPPC